MLQQRIIHKNEHGKTGTMTTRYFQDGRGATLELEEVEGVLYPYYHDHLEDQLANIRHMTLRDSDVILCTYPKAGTHWLWEILHMLTSGATGLSGSLKRVAMLENTDLEVLGSSPTSSPRVLNTHLLPQAMPTEMMTSRCKIVICHRNPKDTVVSLYNMASQVSYKWFRSAFEGSFEGYASLFLEGKMPHGSWFDYVRAWEKLRMRLPADRVHVTSYEAMSRDAQRETARIADFLGVESSPEHCRMVVDACSFQNLRDAGKHREDRANLDKWKPNATGIFRKGKVGDWRDWFSGDLSQKIDLAVRSKLHDLDITFNYDL